MSNAVSTTKKAMAAALINNRTAIIALLKKHGIQADKNLSDQQLIVGMLKANSMSHRFRGDLGKTLAGIVAENQKSFVGEYGFFNFGPEFPEQSGDGVSTTTTEKKPSQVFTAANIQKLFDTGLTILSTTLTAKSNQKLAQTAKEIEEEKTKQAALAAAGKGVGGSTKPGLSTGAKIAIAIGVVAVVGTIVYFIVRKK